IDPLHLHFQAICCAVNNAPETARKQQFLGAKTRTDLRLIIGFFTPGRLTPNGVGGFLHSRWHRRRQRGGTFSGNALAHLVAQHWHSPSHCTGSAKPQSFYRGQYRQIALEERPDSR
ncbi:MAG: hypothetical protein ACREE6_18920, partial [Limisphaerales bacterium]